jgi:hypothetical protein
MSTSGTVGHQNDRLGDPGTSAVRSVAMDASELDTRYAARRTRSAGSRSLLAIAVSAAIGLSACGGSSHAKSDSTSAQAATTSAQTVAQAPTNPAATTASNAAGASTTGATSTTGQTGTSSSSSSSTAAGTTSTGASTTTDPAKSPSKTPTPVRSKKKHPGTGPTSPAPTTGTVTTIAANAAAPAYTGPSPIACLEAAGLNRARAGIEQGAWEANYGVTSESDSNALVFLSGPYKDDGEATSYAQSLQGVELSASAGRWVASASMLSHLQPEVNAAAACMGSGAS